MVAEPRTILVHAAAVIRSSKLFLTCLILSACGDDDGTASTSDSTGTTSTGTSEGPSTSTTASGSEGSSSTGSSSGGSSSSADDDSGSSTGAVDSGLELLVCSFGADSVSRFDLDDGSFLGHLGPTTELDGALGIVVGPDGDIYVASEESNQVLRFSGSDGSLVAAFVTDDPRTPDDETGGLLGPGAVLFGPDGALYVSSFDSDAILRYDGATGGFIDAFVPSGAGGLNGPDAGMVFGPDGALYVPGYYSDTIERFDGRTGEPLGDFTPTGMLDAPRTVVFAGDRLYVANEGSDEVLRFDAATGDFVDVFVAAGAGGLDAPGGMVFGPDGVLHVASVNGNTVLRFDPNGTPLPTLVDAAAAGIDGPTHITLAPALGG